MRADKLRLGRLNGRGLAAGAVAATVRDVEYQGTHVQLGLDRGRRRRDLSASLPERAEFVARSAGARATASPSAGPTRDAHRLG